MIILSFDPELAKLVTLAGNGELLTKGMFQRVIILDWNSSDTPYFPIKGLVRGLHGKKDKICHWNAQGRALENLDLSCPGDDYYDLFIYSPEEDV